MVKYHWLHMVLTWGTSCSQFMIFTVFIYVHIITYSSFCASLSPVSCLGLSGFGITEGLLYGSMGWLERYLITSFELDILQRDWGSLRGHIGCEGHIMPWNWWSLLHGSEGWRCTRARCSGTHGKHVGAWSSVLGDSVPTHRYNCWKL